MRGHYCRLQFYRKRRAGEICHQLFQDWCSSPPQCHSDFPIAVPGLGHMAISGHETWRHYKPRSSHARTKTLRPAGHMIDPVDIRSEEHTSELQSLRHLVCRLLLEKKRG